MIKMVAFDFDGTIVDIEELKKINPTYIFNNISGLKIFLESKLSDVCCL